MIGPTLSSCDYYVSLSLYRYLVLGTRRYLYLQKSRNAQNKMLIAFTDDDTEDEETTTTDYMASLT